MENSGKSTGSGRESIKKSFFYLKIMVALAIFWMLARHAQLKFSLIYAVFEHPLPTFTVIGLCYVMVIAHTWRWYRLNSAQGIHLTFTRTVMPTYLGIAFNNVLPGSVGGDFIRLYYALKKFPEKKSRVVISILIDRILGLMGIFIIACVCAPYYLEIFRHDRALFYLLSVCVGCCLIGLIVFFGSALLLSEKIGLARWLEKKSSATRWAKPFVSILDAIHVYRNAKLVIVESIIVSMFTQFLLLIVVILISKMMGLPLLSPFNYLLALVIGQVANLIPLTPGGIGVGEAAFANIILLLNPGMTAAYATAFLALRLLSTFAYLPGVFIGIFGFNLLHKNVSAATAEVSV